PVAAGPGRAVAAHWGWSSLLFPRSAGTGEPALSWVGGGPGSGLVPVDLPGPMEASRGGGGARQPPLRVAAAFPDPGSSPGLALQLRGPPFPLHFPGRSSATWARGIMAVLGGPGVGPAGVRLADAGCRRGGLDARGLVLARQAFLGGGGVGAG